MNCPFCMSHNIKVIETREVNENNTRRRRQCEDCSQRFTTYEKIGDFESDVIKKDGSLENFNPEKIRKSLDIACKKRPVSDIEKDAIVKKIKREAELKGKLESKCIGKMIMDELKKLDEVSYIRFASVYKNFKSVGGFEKEIKKMR